MLKERSKGFTSIIIAMSAVDNTTLLSAKVDTAFLAEIILSTLGCTAITQAKARIIFFSIPLHSQRFQTVMIILISSASTARGAAQRERNSTVSGKIG
jgi:hypothetical protein